jgi:hypothetical protein
MDISSIQRDLENLQKTMRDLNTKISSEKDPLKKAELRKKLAELEVKRSKLDASLEDEVTKLHSDVDLQLNSRKLTAQEKILVKEYIKKIIRSK